MLGNSTPLGIQLTILPNNSHVRRLTSVHNSPMPVIDTAHQHFLTARALHKAAKDNGTAKVDTLDWSAIIVGPRVNAGLDGFDSEKV